jgi:hypothetical protein
MNSDELEAAIERAGEMNREQLLALVRECKAHLDLRQLLARDLADGVARWITPPVPFDFRHP